VDPAEGCVHVEFIDTLKVPQFQEFLERVIDLYRDKGKIIMILDNARAHHAKFLQPFLEKVKDILELMFFPPYSPNLNPIEHFWKFMCKNVTHNTFFSTFQKFLEALSNFFNKFKLPSTDISSLCRII